MMSRAVLLLLLAGTASALDVYVVASRGRPIGPSSERGHPEPAADGATGLADDSDVGIARAEYLMSETLSSRADMSSPPHDLPILRESVASMPMRTTEQDRPGLVGALVLLLRTNLAPFALTACAAGAGALAVMALKTHLMVSSRGGKTEAAKEVARVPEEPNLQAQEQKDEVVTPHMRDSAQ